MANALPLRFSPSCNTVVAGALLAAAIVAVYFNGVGAPFVFDDIQSITENPTIRHLNSAAIASPPAGLTVSGRPVVNISLAFNYAAGGSGVRGYHFANIAIHVFAAWALFGVLRRTFLQPRLCAHFGAAAGPLALGATLLWALHPLQTESVTYTIQRAESLMGLFYLLTLYGFVRSLDSPRPRQSPTGPSEPGTMGTPASRHDSRSFRAPSTADFQRESNLIGYKPTWPVGEPAILQTAALFACALGMATKEVMVSAPIVVLLYDRIFVATSFREIARARGKFHGALAATWLVLAFLAWHAGGRAGTAGLSAGVTPWAYALTQCHAVVHYLRLTVWPHPLVFDYGPFEPAKTADVLPSAVFLALLVFGVFLAGRRQPAVAFAAAFFFFVLAPSSSIVPIATEPVAEHRMYLPLAALAALSSAGIYTLLGGRWYWAVVAPLAAGLGALTFQRNEDYRSARALWESTVRAAPQNPRAHGSLAWAFAEEKNFPGAERHFKAALALRPDDLDARHGLARIFEEQGRPAEAKEQLEAILRTRADDFVALSALGTVELQLGNATAAARRFEAAVRAKPGSAIAHNNLGSVFYELGNFSAANEHEEAALRLDPNYPEAHYNLGNVLAQQGRLTAARDSYLRALRLRPGYLEAHINLGAVLQSAGDRDGAIEHYRAALRIRPDLPFVQKNLERLLASPPQ